MAVAPTPLCPPVSSTVTVEACRNGVVHALMSRMRSRRQPARPENCSGKQKRPLWNCWWRNEQRPADLVEARAATRRAVEPLGAVDRLNCHDQLDGGRNITVVRSGGGKVGGYRSPVRLRRTSVDQAFEAGSRVEDVIAFISCLTMKSLKAIRNGATDSDSPIGLRPKQFSKRIKQAARAAGLGNGFSGHPPRIGRDRDLARAGTELAGLTNAGRRSSTKVPGLYTRNWTAGRETVAQFCNGQCGVEHIRSPE